VLATENAGTQLSVLEPAAGAGPKIGAQDQWLNVEDGKGLKGFVAAWYVQLPEGTPPPPAPPSGGAPTTGSSAPTPAAALTVVVSEQATAGLRLRTQPNAAADTLTILAAGTRLAVVEPAAAAMNKIGVNGRWLYAREPGGTTGYVAAWYVQVAS
jgi:hypothetical protein